MPTRKKVLLSALLVLFIGISLLMSFNMVTRPTYEFSVTEEKDGWIFDGFNGNADITSVTIDKKLNKTKTENGVEWIPDETEKIVSVDKYTIISDEYVEEIFIGPCVERIDECAFEYCKQLKAIHVDQNNPYYTDEDGVLFNKDKTVLLTYPLLHQTNGENTTEYEVPSTVTRLADNCFYKCEYLQKVVLPEGLEEIGRMAFFKCSSMTLVTLPSTVKTIGSDAFSYCTNMRWAMFIPASVERIDHHCFYKCDRLEKFYVENTEDGVVLESKWMPKSENSLSSDDAVFSADRRDYEAYNASRLAEEERKAAENAANAGTDTAENGEDGMNKTAVILLIVFVFVPGFAIVAVEVVRNLFKEDFLMTAKGKEKLRRTKEERERIHEAYLNGTPSADEGKEENSHGEN